MAYPDVFRPMYEPLIVRNFMEQVLPEHDPRNSNPNRYERPPSRAYSFTSSEISVELPWNQTAFNYPQCRRVKLMKGLLDEPICRVDDSRGFPVYAQKPEVRYKHHINVNTQQAPLDTISGLPMCGVQGIPYSIKACPLVTASEPWRMELKALTEAVFNRDISSGPSLPVGTVEVVPHHPFPLHRPITPAQQEIQQATRILCSMENSINNRPCSASNSNGRLLHHRGRYMAPNYRGGYVGSENWQNQRIDTDLQATRLRGSKRQNAVGWETTSSCYGNPDGGVVMGTESFRGGVKDGKMDGECEDQVFNLLCQVLKADSMSVQSWLGSASDREKALALQLIKSAITGSEYIPPIPEATHLEDNLTENLSENIPEIDQPVLSTSDYQSDVTINTAPSPTATKSEEPFITIPTAPSKPPKVTSFVVTTSGNRLSLPRTPITPRSQKSRRPSTASGSNAIYPCGLPLSTTQHITARTGSFKAVTPLPSSNPPNLNLESVTSVSLRYLPPWHPKRVAQCHVKLPTASVSLDASIFGASRPNSPTGTSSGGVVFRYTRTPSRSEHFSNAGSVNQ